jgi:ABC-type nitrate/sulfonate/bicarbonate transport system substrate-binding protein
VPRRRRSLLLPLAIAWSMLAACSSDSAEPSLTGVTVPVETAPDGSVPGDTTVERAQPFPAERCAANKAAGTITYLSGFDYSAAASIIDVLVAERAGYYRALCLDVVTKPNLSTDNYPLIAANQGQFASGGSFGEMVDFAGRNDAGFVALSVEGRTGIDELITKKGAIDSLDDVKHKTIGVRGTITASVKAMLLKAGLTEGEDYDSVQLEGLDPTVQIDLPNIIGFPAYKSNEPLELATAGIPFDAWDPAKYAIPGSFGVIYTNRTFLDQHPTAAADFMRATMRGLADALADPGAAAQVAIDKINANGNPNKLSPVGEVARWKVESGLVSGLSSLSEPPGVPQPELLQAEVTTYGQIGVFSGLEPDWTQYVDQDLVKDLYADGALIWPA